MNIIINAKDLDYNKYIIATYNLKSIIDINDAAHNIAIGQSIGNPSVRSMWETQELIDNHCCKIIHNDILNKQSGKIQIAFPIANIDWNTDGVSHLLCMLMGGQLDINSIIQCHLVDLQFPSNRIWNTPAFGIDGIRKYTNIYNKPILGGIVKPKTGISPQTLLDIVKCMCDNGINFIKEDEIMSNPQCCTLRERASIICNYLNKNHPNVIYSFCITSDYPYCIQRAKMLKDYGANSLHINVWNGLGIYKTLREMNLDMFIHFQKSGDKIFTNGGKFSIAWSIICKLAGMMGVDFIHAGMWGGYSDDDNIKEYIDILHKYNVMPALSCGMHPGLVNKVTELFGNDYMANVGGAIHGHPDGTAGGVQAMRQAIDMDFKTEYYNALDKWGLIL